ncbi:MAG: LPP20 family lipoprotein [Helicobacter sp.]|nr:LPP20 family lipoprotein [Helicobacter sp.]
MTRTSISLALAGMLLGASVSVFATTAINDNPVGSVSLQASSPAPSSIGRNSNNPVGLPGMEVGGDEVVIPNAPIITPSSIIEISAVGMGVAPDTSYSPAQALALAKRAAIVDAYRQIGEKMYGIRVNAQDTVRDMVLKNSTVKTKLMAVIRNAEIVETVYKDGLCQVSMELKLDGKRWYRVLTGEEF